MAEEVLVIEFYVPIKALKLIKDAKGQYKHPIGVPVSIHNAISIDDDPNNPLVRCTYEEVE